MWCTRRVSAAAQRSFDSWRSCGGRPAGPLVAGRGHRGHPLQVLQDGEEGGAPMAESTMPGMDVIRKQLVDEDGDLLRELVHGVVHALMSAEADAACGAEYGGGRRGRGERRHGGGPGGAGGTPRP